MWRTSTRPPTLQLRSPRMLTTQKNYTSHTQVNYRCAATTQHFPLSASEVQKSLTEGSDTLFVLLTSTDLWKSSPLISSIMFWNSSTIRMSLIIISRRHFLLRLSFEYWTLSEVNKKLCYQRGTAQHAMSVEILSTTAQLYKESQFKSLQ